MPSISTLETELEALPNIKLSSAYMRDPNKKLTQRKLDYADKLKNLLDEYNSFVIITIDNIQSSQIDQLRKKFHGKARFLFGKNTLMRKVIVEHIHEKRDGKLLNLLELLKGNSGLLFTKENPDELMKEIRQHWKRRSAKVGQISPKDVYVSPGSTGIEPKETLFFQSMNIATKISNHQIYILEKTKIINKNEKINLSQVKLLSKLNIKPFYYYIKYKASYKNGIISYNEPENDFVGEQEEDKKFENPKNFETIENESEEKQETELFTPNLFNDSESDYESDYESESSDTG